MALLASFAGLVVAASFAHSDKAPSLTKPLGLMRRRMLRRIRSELPTAAEQRETLSGVLSHLSELSNPAHPESAAAARARGIERAMRKLGARQLEDATDDQVTELFVLHRLFLTDPGEAGRLAQFFRKPAEVLMMRDDLARAAERRARFDQQHETFEATCLLWALDQERRHAGLLDKLQEMTAPDPDLWHHIVLNHELGQPEDERIALWCLAQPECERATIIVFLRRILASGRLLKAAEAGDCGFLEAVQAMLTACPGNKNRTIGLNAVDDPESADAAARDVLAQVADLSGIARWVLPGDLFEALPGRKPRPRDHWNLARGTLIAPPRIEDYVDGTLAEIRI